MMRPVLAAFLALAVAAPQATPQAAKSYDYVVIGGGTAGLVVATRLATKYNVAVIEAGGQYETNYPILGSIPGADVIAVGAAASENVDSVDWGFFTTPQPGALNRTIRYTRGKTLGGSSARNFMIYQRGTIKTYQKWADQVGDQSYTFDSLLPYFKKSVKFTPPNTAKRAPNATTLFNANSFDPAGGPLSVSYANYAGPFSSYMQGGMNEIGLNTVNDFNGGSLFGTQYCASTIDPSNEKRASSEQSFLQAFGNNPKLTVLKNTLAKKIVFDTNKRATGVVITTQLGVQQTLNVTREVIVSAGAFQSPQILMVSGIGPAATLNSLKIPVLVNNPNVGQNMVDHVFAGPSYRVNVQTFTRLANSPGYILQQLGPYARGEGPLTNPVCDYLGWEKVPQSLRSKFTPEVQSALQQFPDDWPEIEYLSGPGYVGQFNSLLLDQPKDGFQYATILAAIVAPLSRGNVTIKSADTKDLPIINPNWLTHPADQAVAVAAYKRVRQAWASGAMQKTVIGPEYYPGPNVTTDAQILRQYQHDMLTVWHAACTCAMAKDQTLGVIDTSARVFGVKGVRVVDASSFPLLPPGHPQSTIYALAEKISDQILKGQ